MKRATKIELLKARLVERGGENTTIRQVAEAFVNGEPEKGICMRFRLSRPQVARFIRQAIDEGFSDVRAA